ncbi:MAG TPA: HAMP domain-containing sensor histidine kinase, partial [Prolixibacteraceae bacterium]|nr:HAMP domain-containing sensor histidine kinase [Prolixibacteraceae bacterium]
GFSDIVIDSYADLADIEYKNKNFQKAYEYQQKHYELRDSVSSFEKEKKLAELQTQYETVQKENEINLLKSEKLIHENELRRNKLFSWTAFIVIFFLLVFIYVGFIFLNQNKKANELLTEKNNQIEAKNRQLSELNLKVMEINKNLKKSETALTLANNTKNRFFSILGHDLRNPFHSIMGQSYLLSKSYDQLSVEERKKYAQDIYQSCEKVNRLLDNLLEWIRTQSEGIVFNPQLTDFQQLVQESIAVLKSNADEKSINIVNKINHKIQITADYTMLETIVRNLIANGIKFTPPGGEVIISAQIQNLHLIVGISDNGVGIAPENMDKLFLVDSNFKTHGTNNERGTGLGLAICKELVSIHHGKIWAESVPGKGSVFHFSIPAPLTR